ncbi:MAG: hypothetical protein ACRELB_25945, partial [Polyangiaceae bacterium]
MRGAVLLATLLAACAPGLPHPVYAPQPTAALEPVDRPPPPARVEIVPGRPSHQAVWIDGEWMWRRASWAWLPGRWVVPPAGASFSAWAFVRRADGTLWYAPGVWRDATGAVMAAPAPLALADVEAGAVVDADGSVESTGPILRARARPAASEAPPLP